jgi:peptidoglycan/xylan/chitin deacetylase (PgdA/CDA1 family)
MPAERQPAQSASASATAFPILLYHGVRTPADASGGPFALDLAAFTEQMDRLAASGRRTVTIGELVAGRRRAAGELAAVTFDDGTADFYHHAWPVLRERGIVATLFVTSGLVGRDFHGSEMLSWEQLEELRDDGVEIGAHGDHHVALDLVGLDRAAIELVNSKLRLEHRLERAVTSFAYPFGYHTEPLERLLPRAGYESGCAVKNRLSHPADDRFALARLTIAGRTSARRFEQLLRGRGAAPAWEGERVRTRAWRAYRRARTRGSSRLEA